MDGATVSEAALEGAQGWVAVFEAKAPSVWQQVRTEQVGGARGLARVLASLEQPGSPVSESD